MTDEALRRELDDLRSRVRRLETRLNDLEPETMPGVGREVPPSSVPGSGGLLDAIGEGLGALGFMKDD
jgi:hypothetical protein